MRILHIANEFDQFGNGIANVVVDLSVAQAAMGFEVAVAAKKGVLADLIAEYGIRHYELDSTPHLFKFARATRRLSQVVSDYKPDILHAHMAVGAGLGWISTRHRKSIHLVSTVHNDYRRSSILLGLADRVVGVSHDAANRMRNRGVPARKLRVIPNGVVGSPRANIPVRHVQLKDRSIVAIGSVSHRKGSDRIFDAFIRIAGSRPDWHLYFIGNVDWPEFEGQVKSSTLKDRVHFLGYTPNPQPYLKMAKLFVLASRQEPFGLVVVEARAQGVPVVATSVGGVPDALSGGAAGILVNPIEAVDGLAAALLRITGSDAERSRLAEATQTKIEDFTTETMAYRYSQIYNELVK